ncbi:MAG: hypothetical protein ACK457_06215 [Flavobacteriia bacterium]
MQKKKFKFMILAGLAGLIAISISVYSCEKERIQPNVPSVSDSERMSSLLRLTIAENEHVCGAVLEKYLISQNGIKVGKAFIYNDAKNLFVTFMTIRGYYMGEAAMHISDSRDAFPLNENNIPAVREFEYKLNSEGLTNLHKFVIPLKDVNEHTYIAATAAVRMLKSGDERNLNWNVQLPANSIRIWIDGKAFGQDGTGKLFKYVLTDCEIQDGHTIHDSKGETSLGNEHSTKEIQ